MLKIFDLILKILHKIESVIAMSMLIILVLINSINLIGRTFFGFSMNNVIEMSRLLLVYMTMLGIFGAYRNKKYIRMDLLEIRCSEKVKVYINVFTEFVVLLFLFFLIPSAIELSLRQMDEFMPGLLVPRGFIPFGVFLGAILLFSNSLYQILNYLIKAKGVSDNPV